MLIHSIMGCYLQLRWRRENQAEGLYLSCPWLLTVRASFHGEQNFLSRPIKIREKLVALLDREDWSPVPGGISVTGTDSRCKGLKPLQRDWGVKCAVKCPPDIPVTSQV